MCLFDVITHSTAHDLNRGLWIKSWAIIIVININNHLDVIRVIC
jgi:hypothetical protein